MTEDLITFLRNQIGIDEDDATACLATVPTPGPGREWAEQIVLEVAAKRLRLALYDELEGDAGDGTWWTKSMADELRKVEALPYAGRPGYREEWRP